MKHRTTMLAILLVSGIAAIAAAPVSAAPFQPGKRLTSCIICHDISAERKKVVGPPLFGVFGSTPSIEVPFKVWDEEALDKWLSGPAKIKPETQMIYQVNDPNQRVMIIKALEDLK